MLDVFTSFQQTPYTFLKFGQGGIYGNKILQETDAYGIFKLRRGVTNADIQNATSTATLHIKPSEAFLQGLESIEGHGIRVDNKYYRIVGVTAGFDYDSNVLEHLTLTLEVDQVVS